MKVKFLKFILFLFFGVIFTPFVGASSADLVNALYQAAYSNQALATKFAAAGEIQSSYYFQGEADAFTNAAAQYAKTNAFDFAYYSLINNEDASIFVYTPNISFYFQGRAVAFQNGLFMQSYYLPLNP